MEMCPRCVSHRLARKPVWELDLCGKCILAEVNKCYNTDWYVNVCIFNAQRHESASTNQF